MSPRAQNRRGKQEPPIHFIGEWLEARRMEPMDLVKALNDDAEDEQIIDKSQVYRWLKGQLPHKPTLERIAAILKLPTGALMMHPTHYQIAKRLEGHTPQEVEKAMRAIDLVLPERDD